MRQSQWGISIVALATSMVGGVLLAAPAQAAVPPAVAHLAAATYDHTITLSWSNPAAAYGPGASVSVRLTRGRTPASTASTGYGVAVTHGHLATARPLTAAATYTFAVWVRDGAGRYSARRTLTTSTRPDVTAPGPVTHAGALGRLTGGTPAVTISWANPDVPDLAGVRVVRSTRPSPTGGTVLATKAPGTSYHDVLPTQSTAERYWYYLAAIDTTGHGSTYVLVPVATPVDETASTMAGTVRNAAGSPLADIAVQQGPGPPMEEGGDPPVYNVTDVRGVWVADTQPAAPDVWSFFAGYGEDGPEPGGLPPSHRPTGYLSAARTLPSQLAGEFRTIADPVVVPQAAAIEGTIRTTAGAPLAGVDVSADTGPVQVHTDAAGHYLLYGLPPGPTPLVADGTSLVSSAAPYGYSVVWSGGANSRDHAADVPTTAGQASHLDLVLEPRGRLTGTVTPSSDVTVQVFDADVDFAVADVAGSDFTKLLRPGSYTVCATHHAQGPHGDWGWFATMPTTSPARRARATTTLGAHRSCTSMYSPSSTSASITVRISYELSAFVGMRSSSASVRRSSGSNVAPRAVPRGCSGGAARANTVLPPDISLRRRRRNAPPRRTRRGCRLRRGTRG